MTQGTPGFSNADDAGDWSGFDVDVCRAVAAAVLGDADAVNYVPLSTTERFTALQSGEVDILSRTTTRTLHRDTALGLNFAPVVFFDGQGFMVREDSGIVSAMELDVVDFFAANGMDYAPVRFERAEEVLQAYDAGQCDVYTSDRSALAARRLLMAEPAVHLLLPETISEEPLAPAVRHVILPQAMRIILPPPATQYLSLAKNTSLAAAIAFPEIIAIVAGTTLTQTGQALDSLSKCRGAKVLKTLGGWEDGAGSISAFVVRGP